MLARWIAILLMALTMNALTGVVHASSWTGAGAAPAGIAGVDIPPLPGALDPTEPTAADPSLIDGGGGSAFLPDRPDFSTALDDPTLPAIDLIWLPAAFRHDPPPPGAPTLRPDPDLDGLLRPPRAPVRA